MIRGEVFEAALDPVMGSEQSGQRPVVVVSRDVLNEVLDTVVIVPLTTLREGRSAYPNQAVVRAPEGGLGVDSIALCEQVRTISRRRLLRSRGVLSAGTMDRIDQALRITLSLD